MRSIIFASLAIILAAPLVNAGGFDSAEFASTYCSLVRKGTSKKEAFALAQVSSYRDNINPGSVMYQGQRMRSDLFKAAVAIADQCPEYVQ